MVAQHSSSRRRLLTGLVGGTLLAVGLQFPSSRSTHDRQLTVEKEWQPKGLQYFQRTGQLELHPLSVKPFDRSQCNRDGVAAMPLGEDMWQRNVPNFLIAGAPKSGTTTLASLIRKHPKVLKPKIKELRYFQRLPMGSNGTISAKAAREAIYVWGGFPTETIREDPSLLTFDATPSYLYKSAFIFPQVLCVCPWVKIIIILRDPVERAFSNYGYMVQRGLTNQTFEELIDLEFDALRESGFTKQFAPASTEEWDAWNKYHALSEQGLIGKGIYDLQLWYLIQSIRLFGKDTRKDLMILQLDDLKQNMDGVVGQMVQFLGLEEFETPRHFMRNEGETKGIMKPETRQRLQEFYQPHNERLKRMVGDAWNEFSSPQLATAWS